MPFDSTDRLKHHAKSRSHCPSVDDARMPLAIGTRLRADDDSPSPEPGLTRPDPQHALRPLLRGQKLAKLRHRILESRVAFIHASWSS